MYSMRNIYIRYLHIRRFSNTGYRYKRQADIGDNIGLTTLQSDTEVVRCRNARMLCIWQLSLTSKQSKIIIPSAVMIAWTRSEASSANNWLELFYASTLFEFSFVEADYNRQQKHDARLPTHNGEGGNSCGTGRIKGWPKIRVLGQAHEISNIRRYCRKYGPNVKTVLCKQKFIYYIS